MAVMLLGAICDALREELPLVDERCNCDICQGKRRAAAGLTEDGLPAAEGHVGGAAINLWKKQYVVSEETLEMLNRDILYAQRALLHKTYGLVESDLRDALAILDRIKGKV